MTDAVFICPTCGPGVAADEDECCTVCGSQVFSSDAPWYVAALAAARAEEREAGARMCDAEAVKFEGKADALAASIAAGEVTDEPFFVACTLVGVRMRERAAAIRAGGGT